MEVWFLLLLIVLMIGALASGFPVAFALPGAAILSIGLAALCGWLFVGDVDAFFIHGGPNEWLSAGVTNFRSLYWVVERDTLIAIPLFIFMGIMLQRSRIAEDLLIAMARLFGPVPGGLGISVVFVGALLAATTGIVGATVIAMGLISLPAMLKHHYSHSLACGSICASGTLGQIIPPSIVLIILADQLSSAADQANAMRKTEYREITGEFAMPSDFEVVSASAGDMFMGALVPGLLLVGLYMLYIFVTALMNPDKAPAVHKPGELDGRLVRQVVLALAPPLVLIFVVLGSILSGIATVNQAGAIGAVGALLMGSYRLVQGHKRAYWPAILALLSVSALGVLSQLFDLNIRHVETASDRLGIVALALVAVTGLMMALGWSLLRARRVDNILNEVMLETAHTTSMVFIILIGAAMLTSAFRGFGGEVIVKDFLTGLPGGFWTQFVVVMLVIFVLGFFLDFIEIAVVVVPIVAPILLANPEANVTAVWLGVMVGLNIQTSFLTPPFGFALFYLRGVADKIIRTVEIYKGAVAFIALQLGALAIAASLPSLVNYLPARSYLSSDTAPPPNNPRLQFCIEEQVLPAYAEQRDAIERALAQAMAADHSMLPDNVKRALNEAYADMRSVFTEVEKIQVAADARSAASEDYRPLHSVVRAMQRDIKRLERDIDALQQSTKDEQFKEHPDQSVLDALRAQSDGLAAQRDQLQQQIPADWAQAEADYRELSQAERKARMRYRRVVDDSYQMLDQTRMSITDLANLQSLQADLMALEAIIRDQPPEVAMQQIAQFESSLAKMAHVSALKSPLSRARRALKRVGDQDKALAEWAKSVQAFDSELTWRRLAQTHLLATLDQLDAAVRDTIGLRSQARLTPSQVASMAACQARHRDISLEF